MDSEKLASFPAPNDVSDAELLQRLQEIQRRTREVIARYRLQPGPFSAMARQARQVVSDPAELSDFFELLINMQEFGTEAKQRAMLAGTSGGKPSGKSDAGTQKAAPSEPESKAPAAKPDQDLQSPGSGGAGDVEVDEKAAEDFFNNLDR